MERESETGPCTAQRGSKISQDPIVDVPGEGVGGGMATCPLGVGDDLAEPSSATGQGETPKDLSQNLEALALREGGDARETGADLGTQWCITKLEKRRRLRQQKRLKKLQKQSSSGVAVSSTGEVAEGVELAGESARVEEPAGEALDVAEPGTQAHPKSVKSAPKKRKVPHGTPHSSGQEAKRVKPGTPMSFKEAAEKALRVAIVFEDDSRLTEDQASMVRQDLIKCMDEDEGPPPRFNESGLKLGAFLVYCADQLSLEWLKSVVPSLTIEGKKCMVLPADQLTRRTKFFVFVPGRVNPVSVVLKRLQKQNPGLKTDLWRVYSAEQKVDGQFLVLGVDDDSLASLERTSFMPYFELSRLHFKQPAEARVGT